MNIKSLKEQTNRPISFPQSDFLTEAWPPWLRRLFGADDLPEPPLPARGTTRRFNAQGGMLDAPWHYTPTGNYAGEGWGVYFGRRDRMWSQGSAPWASGAGPSWRPGPGWKSPHGAGGQYHPNDAGWFWVPASDGGQWGWRRFDNPADVPKSAFPQGTAPHGERGHQAPMHGPNGYPLSPNEPYGEMPTDLNGNPWTHDPFTGEAYGYPPPWDVNPPAPMTKNPWINPELPSQEVDGPTDAGRPAGLPPFNGGGNEGPRSAPPISGTAYSPPAAPPVSRTLQGLRAMAGAR
jgi:hypothetical protein